MPEVETIRRDLAASVIGRKIVAVHILTSKTAKNPAAFFKASLLGQEFSAVSRRGKLLFFHVGSGQEKRFLLVHLKMTGQLVYVGRRKKIAGGHSLKGGSFLEAVGKELPHKHTRAWLEFQDKSRLFFNDLRRFGYLKIVSRAELEQVIARGYGPEPLAKDFFPSRLAEICRQRKTNIKAVLLNQKLIAGLGNIYVDESLYAARINPHRPANRLKPDELRKLHSAINLIIRKAIRYRGTTFSDYVDSRGRRGNFSRQLRVYGRPGQPCLSCDRPLVKEKIAGRGTHFCPHCQK